MRVLAAILGLLIMWIILWDAFETVILPRRVTRRFRLATAFYRLTWKPVAAAAQKIETKKRRESFIGYYGPLSLPMLLTLWALGLVFAFALLQWAAGEQIHVSDHALDFSIVLYFSGTTFFTLGLGDISPASGLSRFLTVMEGGMGFGFLALILGYLPVLYNAFSIREANITLLDARAGSPPTAGEFLRRQAPSGQLRQLFADWESWSARLLESHLSYPVLAFFRSQHDNQSWLAALTTVLDASAFAMAALSEECTYQAELTFALGRHAAVDLAAVFRTTPSSPPQDRLPPAELEHFQNVLSAAGLASKRGPEVTDKLNKLRSMYEPYVNALSERLLFPLPQWLPDKLKADNWQTSQWGKVALPETSRKVLARLPDEV
ncbi:MAG TPA: potassium channel family protein [Terriglobales bacterium]|nr:potassium channel family protein [Terriglobales bacterium]